MRAMLCKQRALLFFFANLLASAQFGSAETFVGGGGCTGSCDTNQGTLHFPVNVNTPVTAGQVNSITITSLSHTYVGDLMFSLLDPNGVSYQIAPTLGGSHDFNNHRYVFVDPSSSLGQTFEPLYGVPIPPSGTYYSSYPLGSIAGPSGEWKLEVRDHFDFDFGQFSSWELNLFPGSCTPSDKEQCSGFATCDRDGANVVCACRSGFVDINGDGTLCEDIDECQDEDISMTCHHLADCINSDGGYACVCPDGFIGDGTSCSNNAWSIRTVLNIPGVGSYTPSQREELKRQYATLLTGEEKLLNDTIVETLPTYIGLHLYGTRMLGVVDNSPDQNKITMFALFENQEAANLTLSDLAPSTNWGLIGATSASEGPALYRWTGGSTSDPLEVSASGLTVDSVAFNSACMSTGCWVIEVTYTAGTDDFNVFYVPEAEASDALSYDPVYTNDDDIWPKSPADTFLPVNHPCSSMDYDPSSGVLPAQVTACCIPEFLAMYRPVSTFNAALTSSMFDACGDGERDRAITRSAATYFVSASSSTPPDGSLTFEKPTTSAATGAPSTIFVDGVFSGMTLSRIDHAEVQDSYIGIYKATIQLDEVELRTLAGQLKGTPGVEHTVDTFIGLVNFSPTGSRVLDALATQVAIHLEKTSFFSVSTHGTNDYTFLQYVNLRLVAILEEDDDFSDEGVSATSDFTRTISDAAQYVQVTFTMGSQYIPNIIGDELTGGLLPLDSVRVGHGTADAPFFADVDATMIYPCRDPDWRNEDSAFDVRLDQTCGPGASVCANPITEDAVPDQFVSFNIPLGFDFFTTVPMSDNNDLSENVFVDMVINAVDKDARDAGGAPNVGGDAHQMKTTLTASIPVVQGGINIFCDTIVAKTDLKDVAQVHLVLGSAQNRDPGEMDRLTVLRDIADTTMQPNANPTEFETDSIEAGLMTVILDGTDEYFGNNGYGMELEDVITIHVMDPSESGAKFAAVKALVDAPGDDNNANGVLDTDGYCLNKAFYFTIDRAANRAHLHPTTPARTCGTGGTLASICPFNPTRPTGLSSATCITRRDIQGRGYPSRVGGFSTAMEIVTADGDYSSEIAFMTTILGASTYAQDLGQNFADVITAEFNLNPLPVNGVGGYRRGFWVNPGYEWTPTQTAGNSIFTLSQQVILFALVNINENYLGPTSASMTLPTITRRMLLSSDAEKGTGITGTGVKYTGPGATDMMQIITSSLDVAQENVGIFDVVTELTAEEACKEAAELAVALKAKFQPWVEAAASSVTHVEVLDVEVMLGDVVCAASRRTLKAGASGKAQVVVAFAAGTTPTLDESEFENNQGISSISVVVKPEDYNFVSKQPGFGGVTTPSDDEEDTASASSFVMPSVFLAVVFAAVALLR